MDNADFLLRAGALLQEETTSFPAAVQRVLALAEARWPPLRASARFSGETTLVTGLSEFPAGGPVVSVPLVRGGRTLGTLSYEIPPGPRHPPVPDPATWSTLGLLVAQEFELRRLGGLPALTHGGLVGSSGVMQEVLGQVDRAAASGRSVLLIGESGTGKGLLAEVLHRRSAVSAGPFVAFNGTALPEAMAETELFGHPKGTGGRYAEARGGSLFLDEVADLSPSVQARLLAVLEGRPTPDPRILASSSRSLEAAVAAGRFLEPLARRLSEWSLQVPPLRDRGADIIALADHFVTRYGQVAGVAIRRISTPALEMLLTYPWPGNVRELAAVMERAVLLSDDEVIHGYHLPPSLQSSVHSETRMHGRLADRLDSLEYEMLVEALKASQGNITQAARELGLTKRIMGLRMEKYELDYRTFRKPPSDLASEDDQN